MENSSRDGKNFAKSCPTLCDPINCSTPVTCLLRNLPVGQGTTVRTRHEQQTGSKLGKEYIKAVYCDHLTCLLRNLHVGQGTTVRTRHEQQTGSKLGKEYIKAVYCHPAYLYLYAEYIHHVKCWAG